MQSYLIIYEIVTGKPHPVQSVLALLDPLLGRATTVVELHYIRRSPTEVRHDETNSRKKSCRSKPLPAQQVRAAEVSTSSFYWQPGQFCFLTNAENVRDGKEESVETCLRHPFGAGVSTYWTRKVHPQGDIVWKEHQIYLSVTLAGEYVGFEQAEEDRWQIYFGPIPLAILDTQNFRLIHHKRTRKQK